MSLIKTAQINPPIPTTNFDWMAWVDGEEESGPTGRGASEVDALRDLAEQLHEATDEACKNAETLDLLRWAYVKLHRLDFTKQEDAMKLDEIESILIGGKA